ncbi:MAG: CCA tRNA nucleotidyltransferase [Bacillota bacterium]
MKDLFVRARLRFVYKRIVPSDVQAVLRRLALHGHQAFVVGGCVRDLVLGKKPQDWDVTTEARPEEVARIFERTVPSGVKHGTMTVLTTARPVEVTTYRIDVDYSDFRHPDKVVYTRDLREDLARRDLTINAMALGPSGELVDPFGGLRDLDRKVIRAVGDPAARFREDALRMMRAVRFSAQLGMTIEPATLSAVKTDAKLLKHVSAERIRDELNKTLLAPAPAASLEVLRETGLLAVFLPELLEGVGFEQNVHHAFTVWEHTLIAVDAIPPVLHLRLAALLHDVAKPRTLAIIAGERHFYDHENLGAVMARSILRRLKYDNETIDRVIHLIRHHMALHLSPQMKDSAVRRLIARVGLDNIRDLLELRRADRMGSGKKPGPVSQGTLRLLARIERVLKEDSAFGLKDLAIDGNDVMVIGGLRPGPAIGQILRQLFEEVLENPALNRREILEARVREMAGVDGARTGQEG